MRVTAEPFHMEAESDPSSNRFLFGYRIRLGNEGSVALQLLTRYWIITDADGREHEVRGEGVVGRQPRLEPGDAFGYESVAPLETPWGTMEGTYGCEVSEGEDLGLPFEAKVGRFYLVSDSEG